jgi:hypothetical protein
MKKGNFICQTEEQIIVEVAFGTKRKVTELNMVIVGLEVPT